jgi:N-acetylneuraminic acid mutarotase
MKKLSFVLIALLWVANLSFGQRSWITSPTPSPVSAYRGATITYNGTGSNPQLYVMGGWGTSSGYFNETSVYNFVGDTWDIGPLIPENAKGGSAVCVDDKIYLLCGNDGGDVNINSKVFLKYNIISGDWEYLAEYPVAARYVSMAYNSNNGLIYCAGGSGDYYMAVDAVNAYNPETDSWTVCNTLPFPSSGGSALVFIGNHLYLIGGLINEPYNKVFKGFIDVNDPANITWTYGMPMPVEMDKLSAAYVGNGNIVATDLSGTFIYDISTDNWSNFDPKPTLVKGGNYATFEFENAYTYGIAGGRDVNNNNVDHIEYYSFEENTKYAATFLITLPDGTPVPNAEIEVAGNTIYTDESGCKVIFLENGTYDYTARFEGVITGGTITIDGESVFVEAMLPVSIEEHEIGLDIYPNPSHGQVYIVIEDSEAQNEFTSVSVESLTGQQVYKSSLDASGNHVLNCSDFNKGIYLIILSGSDETKIVRKLMIN